MLKSSGTCRHAPEDHAHRHEDRRTVEVERVARRQHQADGLLRAAEERSFIKSRGNTLSDEAVPSTMKISSLM